MAREGEDLEDVEDAEDGEPYIAGDDYVCLHFSYVNL